jgi:Tfp pilus assembly protein PilN
LSYEKLSELCGTGLILHTDPPRGSSFVDAQPLLAETPLLQEYNLLPDSYRRPDYLKMVAVLLVVLNLVVLGWMIWLRFDNLRTRITQTEAEIAALMPLVAEVDKTKAQIKKVEGFVATMTGIGKNPDLIGIMQALTSDLPGDSYLDQFKFDSKARLVTITGYANDLTQLTDKLKNLGEVRLKSTSRRKDRNYFQVEIALHE